MKIISVASSSIRISNPDAPNTRGRLTLEFSGTIKLAKTFIDVRGKLMLKDHSSASVKGGGKGLWTFHNAVLINDHSVLFAHYGEDESLISSMGDFHIGTPFLLSLTDGKFESIIAKSLDSFKFDDKPITKELLWSLVSLGSDDDEFANNAEVSKFLVEDLVNKRAILRREALRAIADTRAFFNCKSDLERFDYAINFYARKDKDLRLPW